MNQEAALAMLVDEERDYLSCFCGILWSSFVRVYKMTCLLSYLYTLLDLVNIAASGWDIA